MAYLLVALGGALGTVARYAVSLWAADAWGERFPWGTIIINITGSFVISFFGTLTLPQGAVPADASTRLFVMVGICGGYTTFSSFSLQTLTLMQAGEWLAALANVLISVLACIAAVTAGYWAAASLNAA